MAIGVTCRKFGVVVWLTYLGHCLVKNDEGRWTTTQGRGEQMSSKECHS